MTRYRVTIDGRIYDVEVDDPRARPVTARIAGTAYAVDVDPQRDEDTRTDADEAGDAGAATLSDAPDAASAPSAEAGAGAAGAAGLETGEADPDSAPPVSGPRTMSAPIPGVVVKVAATVGRTVERGDELLTIEAMKMFNVMRSPWPGAVATVHIKEGDQVVQGQPLVTLTPP